VAVGAEETCDPPKRESHNSNNNFREAVGFDIRK
jgi:hypothetical protein